MKTFPHFIASITCFLLLSCTAKTSSGETMGSSKESTIGTNSITDRESTFSHFSELEIATADYQLRNGDFESGNLDNWYKENDTLAFQITNDAVDIWQNPVAKEGNYYLGFGVTNYNATNESYKGRIRSSLFKLGGSGKITFSMAGGSQENLKAKLMLFNPNGEDEEICIFNNSRYSQGGLSGFILVPYYIRMDIESYMDKLFYFVFEDNDETNFGFINVDYIKTYYEEDNGVDFFSKQASFMTAPDRNKAIEGATLVDIEFNNTLQREYNYNEDFSKDSLLVYGIYSNKVKVVLEKNKVAIDKSAFKKNVPGTYTIQVMIVGTAIGKTFDVTVKPEGEYRRGSKKVNQDDELLVFGDSQMAMWGNLKSNIGVFNKVTNVAVGGSTSDDWMTKIDTLCTKQAPFVLMNLGGNDIRNRAKTPKYIASNIETIIQKFKTSSPNSHLYMFELSCGNATYYNYYDASQELISLYKDLEAKYDNFTVIGYKAEMFGDDGLPNPDCFREDKLHVNPNAYPILAKAFRKYLIIN